MQVQTRWRHACLRQHLVPVARLAAQVLPRLWSSAGTSLPSLSVCLRQALLSGCPPFLDLVSIAVPVYEGTAMGLLARHRTSLLVYIHDLPFRPSCFSSWKAVSTAQAAAWTASHRRSGLGPAAACCSLVSSVYLAKGVTGACAPHSGAGSGRVPRDGAAAKHRSRTAALVACSRPQSCTKEVLPVAAACEPSALSACVSLALGRQ